MKNLSDIIQYEELDNLELLARQIVEGFIIGLHRSPFHGFSVEFAEHRQYNKGESTKYIDWKLFARSGKMFVKQFEEETNLRAHLVLDTSSSMLFPSKEKRNSKLGYSVMCAAALVHLLRQQRDAVGLCTFSEKIDLLTPSKLSAVHAQRMYAELENLFQERDLELHRETRISEVLHQLAEGIHKRSLVIVFTDLMSNENPSEIFESLQHLRYNMHEVLLFVVRDRKLEEDFEFTNRPTKFIDLESGQSIKLNPGEIREHYSRKQQEILEELRIECGQFSIDLVEADIQKDFREVLLPFLMKRSKLF
ncbi:MAG: DUF58 domain-containing protein [Marinifilaceae bacterium]